MHEIFNKHCSVKAAFLVINLLRVDEKNIFSSKMCFQSFLIFNMKLSSLFFRSLLYFIEMLPLGLFISYVTQEGGERGQKDCYVASPKGFEWSRKCYLTQFLVTLHSFLPKNSLILWQRTDNLIRISKKTKILNDYSLT